MNSTNRLFKKIKILLWTGVFYSSQIAHSQMFNAAVWQQPNQLVLFAGTPGGPGNLDGIGLNSRFNEPYGIAIDSFGNLFVADALNFTIRKITPGGVVTTFAGVSGSSGSADGLGSAARFYWPEGLAIDASNNIYVGDVNNYTIRKISPAGQVSTIAGLAGTSGTSNGTGTAAKFMTPEALAVDSAGNVYIADAGAHTIRMMTPAGMVTTIAGTAGSTGTTDGIGAAARFHTPSGIGLDSSGNIYVADSGNYTIRKIASGGVVTTIAGLAGTNGTTDGTGTNARFFLLSGLSSDSSGNLYVTDNTTIRKITSAGAVTTVAGVQGTSGTTDGTGTAASFNNPTGVILDAGGNLYITDYGRSNIRKMTPATVLTSIAGNPYVYGYVNGTGTAALFNNCAGIAIDSGGNSYVSDSGNFVVRKITPAGVVSLLAGSPGNLGTAYGTGTAASFYNLTAMAIDSSGNIYGTDYVASTIRKITSAGAVTTPAGQAFSSGSANGSGSTARFKLPKGITVNSAGTLIYIADTGNQTIRQMTSAGAVTTLAGTAGSSGTVDGTGVAARFTSPTAMAIDSAGNIYVGDNCTIRKITAAGIVSTIAGVAAACSYLDGTGTAARFGDIQNLAMDSSGNLYIADDNMIRKMTPGLVVSTQVGAPPKLGNLAGYLPSAINYPTGLATFGNKVYFTSDNGVWYFQSP